MSMSRCHIAIEIKKFSIHNASDEALVFFRISKGFIFGFIVIYKFQGFLHQMYPVPIGALSVYCCIPTIYTFSCFINFFGIT